MRILIRVLVLLSLGSLAAAASGQGIVVRAEGPSAQRFPVGTIIPIGTPPKLRHGDVLTIADANGTRLLIGGKGEERRADDPAILARVEQALSSGRQRARLAGTRSTDRNAPASTSTEQARGAPPNLWVIDYGVGGTWCIIDPDDVQLWRPLDAAGARLNITSDAGLAKQLRWGRGLKTLAWPGGMPVSDGGNYIVAEEGERASVITLRILDGLPSTSDEIARQLSEFGCYDQLEQLHAAITPRP